LIETTIDVLALKITLNNSRLLYSIVLNLSHKIKYCE